MTYSLTGPGGVKVFSTITDYLGRATLPPTGLAPGTYTVTASFAGDTTYTAATRTRTLVVSGFSGFFQPVDNPPTSTSSTRAGRSRSSSASAATAGSPIFAAGYPRVVTIACGSGAPTDEIETDRDGRRQRAPVRPGQRRVHRTPGRPQKSWTGCRRLELLFVDGSLRVADFKFK